MLNNNSLRDRDRLFYAIFDKIAPAANKYMATLFNSDNSNLFMVTRILKFNWQVAAFSESTLEQYLVRITARTVGTGVTIRTNDMIDTIPSGIVADTNSTVVTENHIIRRFQHANNEPQSAGSVPQIPDYLSYLLFGDGGARIWSHLPEHKGLVLRKDEGISVRNVTSSTVGGVSYVIEFTQVYE